MFSLENSATADEQLSLLRADRSAPQRHYKAVSKALRLLVQNPRHPSLQTHEWVSELCPHGHKLWEAYAENQTSGAYRIFFCYAPGRPRVLCIVAITAHP